MLTWDKFESVKNGDRVKECIENNSTVSVAFIKKDGSVRHMAFRRFLQSYVKSDREKTEAQKNVAKNNNMLIVYDTNVYIKNRREYRQAGENIASAEQLASKTAYRMVSLGNVLAFMCGGKVMDCREINGIKERFGEEIYNALTSGMVSNMSRDVEETEKDVMAVESYWNKKRSLNEMKKFIRNIISEEFRNFKGR